MSPRFRTLATAAAALLVAMSVPLALPTAAQADTGCATPAAPSVVGNVYQVSTPAHLMWLKDSTNLGTVARLSGSYLLVNDIDLTGCTWTTPIADGAGDGNCTAGAGCFAGTFDGNGKVVRNFTLTMSGTGSLWTGFFGDVVDGTVRNLTVEGTVTVTATQATSNSVYAGIVVGYVRGASTIEDVTASGTLTVTTPGGVYAGGVLGAGSANLLSGLSSSAAVSGTSTGANVYSGGVIGLPFSAASVLRSSGSVTAIGTDTIYAGGVVASSYSPLSNIQGSASVNVTRSSGSGQEFAGGLVGYLSMAGTFSGTASGNVTASGSSANVGGLLGYTTTAVSNASASGSVSVTTVDSAYVGGLLGYQGSVAVSDVSSTGSISVTGTGSTFGSVKVGGLASSSSGPITRSWSSGPITVQSSLGGSGFVGGLVGQQMAPLSQSYANREITLSSSSSSPQTTYGVGGLVGASYDTIQDCYALGTAGGSSNDAAITAGGIASSTTSTIASVYTQVPLSFVSANGTVTTAGAIPGDSTLTASFCPAEASPCSNATSPTDRGIAATALQMRTPATFVAAGWSMTDGFSASTTWGICTTANDGLPFLSALQTRNPCVPPDPIQLPPSWFQATQRPSADAECPKGWAPSWAQWPHGGTGGWVCGREIYYDIATNGWAIRGGGVFA